MLKKLFIIYVYILLCQVCYSFVNSYVIFNHESRICSNILSQLKVSDEIARTINDLKANDEFTCKATNLFLLEDKLLKVNINAESNSEDVLIILVYDVFEENIIGRYALQENLSNRFKTINIELKKNHGVACVLFLGILSPSSKIIFTSNKFLQEFQPELNSKLSNNMTSIIDTSPLVSFRPKDENSSSSNSLTIKLPLLDETTISSTTVTIPLPSVTETTTPSTTVTIPLPSVSETTTSSTIVTIPFPSVSETTTASTTVTIPLPSVSETTTPSTTVTIPFPSVSETTNGSTTVTIPFPSVSETTTASTPVTIPFPSVSETTTPSTTVTIPFPSVSETTTPSTTVTIPFPSVSETTTSSTTVTIPFPSVSETTTSSTTVTIPFPSVSETTTPSTTVTIPFPSVSETTTSEITTIEDTTTKTISSDLTTFEPTISETTETNIDSTTYTSPITEEPEEEGFLTTFAIVMISLGSVAVVAIIGTGAWFLCRSNSKGIDLKTTI